MRTTAVQKRTTLLLVRYRLHLTLPTRAAETEPRRMVAEEARMLAFRGAPQAAEWLAGEEVAALLSAEPSGNVLPDATTPLLERVIGGLGAVAGHLDETADGLSRGAAHRAHPGPGGGWAAGTPPDRGHRAETGRRAGGVRLPAVGPLTAGTSGRAS